LVLVAMLAVGMPSKVDIKGWVVVAADTCSYKWIGFTVQYGFQKGECTIGVVSGVGRDWTLLIGAVQVMVPVYCIQCPEGVAIVYVVE